MSEIVEDKLVGYLSEIVAKKCGMYPAVTSRLRVAAGLHDVGKIKIPDTIVNKPGKLTPKEFEVMKTHTVHGAKMLENVQGELGVMARTISMMHHEQWDGKGYWNKYLCDLPAYVAIVSIADVFIALLSVRAYKSAWPPDEAIEYIRKKAGTKFSPSLVEIFVELVQHDKSIQALFANETK